MGIITDLRGHFAGRDLNANGQPVNARFRGAAVADRQISELLGMVRMVLADGEVEQHEAAFLLQWLEANRECASSWPANVLYDRLRAALEDGRIDAEEEAELLTLLARTVGQPAAPGAGLSASHATRLPLTEPAPPVVFAGRSFCITGKLYSGSRIWAFDQIQARGGLAATGITKKLDYLLIGDLGSRDWAQSSHGRKIEKAVAYVADGLPLIIIGEEHWHRHLSVDAP